ncbi:hypothetical protein BZZ01_20165 [Nostocales cyanobacterium HT-58-2]|nr:hypothetical protein BZZ01_20165 [Nostocales cyanobacterium HT-58-2]
MPPTIGGLVDYLFVPRLDTRVENEHFQQELISAMTRVLDSGQYIGGPEVESFEHEVSNFLGVEHAIGVASGTDALTIALLAIVGIEAQDGEVITSPVSYCATGSAILRAGLQPRFVDIDEESFNLSPELVEAAIGPEIRAVLPVDLYGRVAEIAQIRLAAGNRPVIEDACQAFGAKTPTNEFAGTLSNVTAFSFFPSKPLGGYGDGGLVVTRDSNVADLVRIIARHGSRERYYSEFPGFNSRLDALQAALLRVKLSRVKSARLQRTHIARCYQEELKDLTWLRLPQDVEGHAWHCFTIRVLNNKREHLIRYLKDRGIEVVVQYPAPLHWMPPFKTGQCLPIAEQLCSELLCLPIWAGMSDAQINHVIQAVRFAGKMI